VSKTGFRLRGFGISLVALTKSPVCEALLQPVSATHGILERRSTDPASFLEFALC
jgi:hypothetical protein